MSRERSPHQHRNPATPEGTPHHRTLAQRAWAATLAVTCFMLMAPAACSRCAGGDRQQGPPLEQLQSLFTNLKKKVRHHEKDPSKVARVVKRWLKENRKRIKELARRIPPGERATKLLIEQSRSMRRLMEQKRFRDHEGVQKQALELLRLNREILQIYRKRLGEKRKRLSRMARPPARQERGGGSSDGGARPPRPRDDEGQDASRRKGDRGKSGPDSGKTKSGPTQP